MSFLVVIDTKTPRVTVHIVIAAIYRFIRHSKESLFWYFIFNLVDYQPRSVTDLLFQRVLGSPAKSIQKFIAFLTLRQFLESFFRLFVRDLNISLEFFFRREPTR